MRVISAIALLLLGSSAAYAEPVKSCRTQKAADAAEIEERLKVTQAIVDEYEPLDRLWSGGFLAGHALMAGGAAVLNVTSEGGGEADMAFAAVGSTLGFLTIALSMPPLIGTQKVLGTMPSDTLEHKKARLLFMEDRLRASAAKARFIRSWLSHTISGLYAVGTSLALWLGYDRGEGALRQVIGSLLIGQGRLIIYPAGVRHDWQAYEESFLTCKAKLSHRLRLRELEQDTSSFSITPTGLGLAIHF